MKAYGKVLQEDYKNDGSLQAVVEIPAGMQEELMDKLNSLTHGSVIVDILKKK